VGLGTWSLHLWDKIKKEGKKKEDGVLVKILKREAEEKSDEAKYDQQSLDSILSERASSMVSNHLHFTVIFLFIKNKIYSQQHHSAQSHLTVKKIGEGYQSQLILLQKPILYI
jgi:hypothetical protein